MADFSSDQSYPVIGATMKVHNEIGSGLREKKPYENALAIALRDEGFAVANHLRITGLEVGLIINFKPSKLDWKRVVKSKRS